MPVEAQDAWCVTCHEIDHNWLNYTVHGHHQAKSRSPQPQECRQPQRGRGLWGKRSFTASSRSLPLLFSFVLRKWLKVFISCPLWGLKRFPSTSIVSLHKPPVTHNKSSQVWWGFCLLRRLENVQRWASNNAEGNFQPRWEGLLSQTGDSSIFQEIIPFAKRTKQKQR